MSFAHHAILWLHVTAAVFTIGPGTAAIMSTPRFIRKRNPVIVGYLFRTTRIYSFGTLLTLVFGLILTGMTHKFSQWWISVSLTLFVVAFVLLLLILRDQRRAITALDAGAGRGPTASRMTWGPTRWRRRRPKQPKRPAPGQRQPTRPAPRRQRRPPR